MSDRKFTSLGGLRKAKLKVPKKPKPEPEPEPRRQEAPRSEEDLFHRAMTGVAPMNKSGRDLHRAAEPPAPAPGEDADEAAARHLRRLVNGDVEFELEHTDEFMQGHVRGLDMKVVRRLRAGAYSVEAHLDLHGLTSAEACESVLFFLRESHLMGRRNVLLIPGRGRNSPGGLGVLKQEVQSWLTRDPLRRVVLAFCTALPRDGGAGALYVLLRKHKKTGGKVAWDRSLFWSRED